MNKPPVAGSPGEMLRAIRRKRGLKQHELAKLADIDQSTISNLENNKNNNPGMKTVAALEEVLQLEPGTLSKTGPAPRQEAIDGEISNHPDSFDVYAEIEEAHSILDALRAGSREQPLVDRLRQFIEDAAGQRAACMLDPELGSLAHYHLKHSGHPESCPCNPCRQARRLR